MTQSRFETTDRRALVAIDLGAESCRVSLLRWHGEGAATHPEIELIHRLPNGPVFNPEEGPEGTLRWPLDRILSGLKEGLRKAAQAAPEGIRSLAVDGWAVDYVRLDADGCPEIDSVESILKVPLMKNQLSFRRFLFHPSGSSHIYNMDNRCRPTPLSYK